MARTLNKLTEVGVKAQKKPGRHSDGGGLYLNVSATGSKSWLFMWTPVHARLWGKQKARREVGLGKYPAVSLAKARAIAVAYRADVAEGLDPHEERQKARGKTFREAADEFILAKGENWNAKHRWQWEQTLRERCAAIGHKPVAEISTADVKAVLTPIWSTIPETASRLRGRIEKVLDFAKGNGWRDEDSRNPAAWSGHLETMLPARPKGSKQHQAALPYEAVPAFVARLRPLETISAKALELTILTVARTGETIGMRWSEIDFDKALWTVPGERMKAGKPHVVPLVPRAVEILRDIEATKTSELKSMLAKGQEATVHGFRSAFRDWAGDMTNFQREVAEAALAHRVGNDVEQAYRRSTALQKRTKLMEAWAGYLDQPLTGNVVPLTKGGAAA